MALDDVLRLISPRTPEKAGRFLRCFYNRNGLARDEIQREAGLSRKDFEYLLTKFRRLKLIRGERSRQGYHYHLSRDGYAVRIEDMLINPIKIFGKGR